MTTHRSLNKLEFKAHMSIHNMKEVPEGETHEAKNRTRDRFGKSHALSDEDGTSRVAVRKRRLKALVLAALFGPLLQAAASADEAATAPARRNTDISVGSEEVDANSWLDKKLNKPEDNFGIPLNDSATVGLNDDGDPNVGMKF